MRNGLERARARRHARRHRAGRRVRRRGHRAGLGRSRADESAVQRSGAAERLARSGPPRGACGGDGAARAIGSTPPARLLHSAGTLTLIWRADGLAEVLAALDGRFGGIAVLPVHGRAGAPAIRVLVRARKGSRAPLALLPGLDVERRRGTADRGGGGGAARARRRCRWLAIKQPPQRRRAAGRSSDAIRIDVIRRHRNRHFHVASPIRCVRDNAPRNPSFPATCLRCVNKRMT